MIARDLTSHFDFTHISPGLSVLAVLSVYIPDRSAIRDVPVLRWAPVSYWRRRKM
ncbi:MAG: hypothetical protein AAGE03_08845 [Pseudomonadota bacterium]